MRISGGSARGIQLKSVDREGLRPATDRMREAVFSSIAPDLPEARCLDLFAGTGAYGLEALSRGAGSVRFVEQNRRVSMLLRQNLEAVCKSMQADPGVCHVEQRDVFSWDPGWERYDIVFLDPPYDMLPGQAPELFLQALKALAAEGLLLFEMPGDLELLHPGLELRRRLGKGRHQPSVCVYGREA